MHMVARMFETPALTLDMQLTFQKREKRSFSFSLNSQQKKWWTFNPIPTDFDRALGVCVRGCWKADTQCVFLCCCCYWWCCCCWWWGCWMCCCYLSCCWCCCCYKCSWMCCCWWWCCCWCCYWWWCRRCCCCCCRYWWWCRYCCWCWKGKSRWIFERIHT